MPVVVNNIWVSSLVHNQTFLDQVEAVVHAVARSIVIAEGYTVCVGQTGITTFGEATGFVGRI